MTPDAAARPTEPPAPADLETLAAWSAFDVDSLGRWPEADRQVLAELIAGDRDPGEVARP